MLQVIPDSQIQRDAWLHLPRVFEISAKVVVIKIILPDVRNRVIDLGEI